jgi:hypothetical protein
MVKLHGEPFMVKLHGEPQPGKSSRKGAKAANELLCELGGLSEQRERARDETYLQTKKMADSSTNLYESTFELVLISED